MNYEGPETGLTCVATRGGELLGYVVIDSLVGGRSAGGLRMQPDVSGDEIGRLARSMTLKYGFLGLPRGGAKAGLIGDPEAPREERRARLAAFAHAISPLLRSGAYAPGTDMGTDSGDIRFMISSVGIRPNARDGYSIDTGPYTALSVWTGAREAMRHLDASLEGATVAVEGFGKVGGAVATLLHRAGSRVVAVSTSAGAIYNPGGLDVDRLVELLQSLGARLVDHYRDAERIDPLALLELPVDLLSPCARNDAIHAGNAPRVSARAICPGANNPITPDAERLLFQRGVLVLPDFITNSGGVLGGRMEFASIPRPRIRRFIESKIGARIASLLDESSRQGVMPRDIAVPTALERFRAMRQRQGSGGARGRLFAAGLEAYRHGWLPGSLVATAAISYFDRMIGPPGAWSTPANSPNEGNGVTLGGGVTSRTQAA